MGQLLWESENLYKVGVKRCLSLSARVVSFQTLEMQKFAGPTGPGPIQTGLDQDPDMSVNVCELLACRSVRTCLLLHRVCNAETGQPLSSPDLNWSHKNSCEGVMDNSLSHV